MYGRNEVEIPHHHLVGGVSDLPVGAIWVNLQNEWTHRYQGLCEMKYETQLVGLEMEMEMGLFYFFWASQRRGMQRRWEGVW